MKLDLTGKVAVVSGSTSGIGQGIAAGLAKAGATVVVVGRKQSGVDDAMAAIAAQTPTASLRGVVADLSTEDGVTALIEFDSVGDLKGGAISIYQYKSGKLEYVETLGGSAVDSAKAEVKEAVAEVKEAAQAVAGAATAVGKEVAAEAKDAVKAGAEAVKNAADAIKAAVEKK